MLSYFNQLWGKTKNIYTFLSAYKIVCLTLYCLNLYRTKSLREVILDLVNLVYCKHSLNNINCYIYRKLI